MWEYISWHAINTFIKAVTSSLLSFCDVSVGQKIGVEACDDGRGAFLSTTRPALVSPWKAFDQDNMDARWETTFFSNFYLYSKMLYVLNSKCLFKPQCLKIEFKIPHWDKNQLFIQKWFGIWCLEKTRLKIKFECMTVRGFFLETLQYFKTLSETSSHFPIL